MTSSVHVHVSSASCIVHQRFSLSIHTCVCVWGGEDAYVYTHRYTGRFVFVIWDFNFEFNKNL